MTSNTAVSTSPSEGSEADPILQIAEEIRQLEQHLKPKTHWYQERAFWLDFVKILISGLVAVLVATGWSFLWAYLRPDQSTIRVCKISLDEYGSPEGKRHMRWEFDIQPARVSFRDENEAWAYANLNVRRSQSPNQAQDSGLDWTEVDRIQFLIRGDRENGQLNEVNLLIGTEPLHYQKLNIPVSTRWVSVTINLQQMTIAEWQKNSSPTVLDRSDLKNVTGLGFTVKTNSLRKSGAFYIDAIAVVKKDGTSELIEGFEETQGATLADRKLGAKTATWVFDAAVKR